MVDGVAAAFPHRRVYASVGVECTCAVKVALRLPAVGWKPPIVIDLHLLLEAQGRVFLPNCGKDLVVEVSQAHELHEPPLSLMYHHESIRFAGYAEAMRRGAVISLHRPNFRLFRMILDARIELLDADAGEPEVAYVVL